MFQDKLSLAKRGPLVNKGYARRRPLALDGVEPDQFYRLFHFDPWWTMRGADPVPVQASLWPDGIEPAIRDAIIATNLAARRLGHLIIRDLVFDNNLERVEEVLVGDGVFRAISYSQTRPMPLDLEETFFA